MWHFHVSHAYADGYGVTDMAFRFLLTRLYFYSNEVAVDPAKLLWTTASLVYGSNRCGALIDNVKK